MERYYETMYILRPTLNDQEITEAIENYKNLLVREGADIYRQEDLGKKKLAYLIKHFQNGHYALYQYKAGPAAVSELERTFKISEDVLRFLTIRLESLERPEPEAVVPEAAEEKTAGTEAVEEKTAETEAAGTEAAGTEAAGTEAVEEKTAETEEA